MSGDRCEDGGVPSGDGETRASRRAPGGWRKIEDTMRILWK